jgi:hypothetical protein
MEHAVVYIYMYYIKAVAVLCFSYIYDVIFIT